MKALRYILPLLLILAVIGMLVYQGFVENNLETNDLTRGLIIILGAVGTMFKKPRPRPVANKKALYESAYSEFIQDAFSEDPRLEKKFYEAVHDYNRDQPGKAIAKLEKLRRECQRSSDLRAVTVFTALSLDDMQCYEEALKQYDAARRIRDCSTLASNMGLCCYRLGDYSRAQDYYEQAIRLDPDNAIVYNNYASLYFAVGDYETALEASLDALARNEKLPQALSTAAICCKLTGDEEGYKGYYRRAVSAGYDGDKIKQAIRKLDPSL